MKIGEFYRTAVAAGIAADLRGSEEINGLLAEAAKELRETASRPCLKSSAGRTRAPAAGFSST